MRLAWFRPATHVSDHLDDTAALITALRDHSQIERIDESRAHEFVRLQFRQPFDLCVYELADTEAHAFVWPYLLHYPGVLRLRSLSLHESRTRSLHRQLRVDDRSAELAFSRWDFLRAPMVASRVTVVSDAHAAEQLRRDFPGTHVRHAPIGLGSVDAGWAQSPKLDGTRAIPAVGSLDPSRAGVLRRAVDRARHAGAPLELMTETDPERILANADIIVALKWPPADELAMVLASMAAGKTVVVFEAENAARWPALDPQTWQPRGWSSDRPVVVSIDPRDEEHSLALALRRLANERALRDELGAAAYAWWREHGTVARAAEAWQAIFDEATSLAPPPRPPDWPPHLTADGTERARQLLAELGATVDFID
jgi:hypothetical protein